MGPAVNILSPPFAPSQVPCVMCLCPASPSATLAAVAAVAAAGLAGLLRMPSCHPVTHVTCCYMRYSSGCDVTNGCYTQVCRDVFRWLHHEEVVDAPYLQAALFEYCAAAAAAGLTLSVMASLPDYCLECCSSAVKVSKYCGMGSVEVCVSWGRLYNCWHRCRAANRSC